MRSALGCWGIVTRPPLDSPVQLAVCVLVISTHASASQDTRAQQE